MINERQKKILKLIVETFVKKGVPISSSFLLEDNNLDVSSATIRNEMMILESLNLIAKPHNQGGRVPTKQGYEYYVDHLMNNDEDYFVEQIQNLFKQRQESIDLTLQKASDIISELTNLTTIIISPDIKEEYLEAINATKCPDFRVNVVLVTSSGKTHSRTYAFANEKRVNEFIDLINILQTRLVSIPVKNLVATFNSLKPILEKNIKNLETAFQNFVLELLSLNKDTFFQSGSFNLVKYDNIDKAAKEKLINLIENHSSFKQFIKNQKRNILINDDGSVIIKKEYQIKGQKGSIAVIGSSQIEYDKVNNIILQVVKEIENKF